MGVCLGWLVGRVGWDGMGLWTGAYEDGSVGWIVMRVSADVGDAGLFDGLDGRGGRIGR